jgi:hypothetical protein
LLLHAGVEWSERVENKRPPLRSMAPKFDSGVL